MKFDPVKQVYTFELSFYCFLKVRLFIWTHQSRPEEGDVEDADEDDGIEQRDSMLENLLVILNSAAAIGVGPSPASFLREEEAMYRTKSRQSNIPGSGKGFQPGWVKTVVASLADPLSRYI